MTTVYYRPYVWRSRGSTQIFSDRIRHAARGSACGNEATVKVWLGSIDFWSDIGYTSLLLSLFLFRLPLIPPSLFLQTPSGLYNKFYGISSRVCSKYIFLTTALGMIYSSGMAPHFSHFIAESRLLFSHFTLPSLLLHIILISEIPLSFGYCTIQ